jgi:hypothetical protein
MAFEAEKDALDSVLNGLDHACRKGAFGLQDAARLMQDVNTLSGLLNGGIHTILSQIVQPPIPEQENSISEGEPEDSQTIPGTKQKVAKPK